MAKRKTLIKIQVMMRLCSFTILAEVVHIQNQAKVQFAIEVNG